MSDSDERPGSKLIDKVFEKASAGRPGGPKTAGALDAHQVVQAPQEVVARPDGVIAQFKANKIQKKVALKHIETWYDGQLEAARHAVAEAVRVRKAEASSVAERLLMAIDTDHLRYLTSLGLRNEAVRGEALKDLGDQTHRLMSEIEAKNWPPQLVEETLHGILERHRKFFDRIMQDLGTERHSK